MYTVGARTATVDAFTQPPAVVQTTDGQYVAVAPGSGFQPATFVQPAVQPAAGWQSQNQQPQLQTVAARQAPSPRRPVRQSAPVREREREREVIREDRRDDRSWQKTAMIIGGSAASGAGVGAIAGGKKGAMIGAAIGGGAASIYEATKR